MKNPTDSTNNTMADTTELDILKDRMRKRMERSVDNILREMSKPENIGFYLTTDPPPNTGFMWWDHPRIRDLRVAVSDDGHSGASFGICCREAVRRLRAT